VTERLAELELEPTATRRGRRLLAVAALAFVAAPATAQPPEPATVGRDRPLTSTWTCENERSVLLNAHPRRVNEEAWLTYAGNRVAVERARGAPGVTFASRDGRVKWHEKGDEATLEFAELLKEPLTCRRQDKRVK
jgi:membrane-bound inhibitor of C-type lysozyme